MSVQAAQKRRKWDYQGVQTYPTPHREIKAQLSIEYFTCCEWNYSVMEIMLDLPPLKERISITPVLLLVAAGHAIMTSSPATLLKCDEIQPSSRPVPHNAGRKNKKIASYIRQSRYRTYVSRILTCTQLQRRGWRQAKGCVSIELNRISPWKS